VDNATTHKKWWNENMEVIIWLILTICAAFFTVLMLTVEDYVEIKGFGIVIAIVCLIFWLVAGLSAVDLTSTFVGYDGSSIVEHTVHYEYSWLILLFDVVAGIFPFLIILKKIPETWDVDE